MAYREISEEMKSSEPTLLAVLVAIVGTIVGCTGHPVEIEKPTKGRPLSAEEESTLQRVADAAFREVHLTGLPPKITLIVTWGKDVNPDTGETGSNGYPGNLGLTLDPDRDVLATIRSWVRPCIVHELNHLARKSRSMPRTFRDRLVSEGLATAFERDVTGIDVEWGRPPPDAWVTEVLALPPDADQEVWFGKHPDGRRGVAMRVGTLLVDRARKASGTSLAELNVVPTEAILRFAEAR